MRAVVTIAKQREARATSGLNMSQDSVELQRQGSNAVSCCRLLWETLTLSTEDQPVRFHEFLDLVLASGTAACRGLSYVWD